MNRYNEYTKRIVFHLSVCFYFQQSVLAALYSSEGSVMEVNSQPVTLHHKDVGELAYQRFNNVFKQQAVYVSKNT